MIRALCIHAVLFLFAFDACGARPSVNENGQSVEAPSVVLAYAENAMVWDLIDAKLSTLPKVRMGRGGSVCMCVCVCVRCRIVWEP
jgi:hypothetical protein